MNFEYEYEQCLEKLNWATKELQVEVEPEKLAEIAELIVQPMTGPWRYFHTPNHIFEVGVSQDAIEVLAALFHDLVYVQVDHSVNFNLSYYLAPYIQETQGKLKIREKNELPKDQTFEMVTSIFGFFVAQVLLPFGGQNEFMSAVVAAKVMETFLTPKHLFQIIACIESTIPFQPISEDGLTATERLYQRLKETNTKLNINLSDGELYETVKKSVRLSNRDVSGFGSPTSIFLDNTWNLLPETNHNLTNGNSYTVCEYRIALEKTEGFINHLNPDLIFRKFDEEPDEKTYKCWVEQAKKNIEVAKIYLGSKIFTLAFIEALSMRLGLNIPLSTMVGELPSQGHIPAHLEDFLPDIHNPYQPQNNLQREVLTLLADGRSQNAVYDMRNSPLSTFMVKYIGFDEVKKQRKRTNDFCQKKISAEEFIDGCNQNLVKTVIEGILELFESRKQAIGGVKKVKYINCNQNH
ncbi:hypothetical protein AFK68_19835 [Hydrocoleum sp. CS-953]|uniref:hypothetical protein n=1 Tax=Hydrocoleum sp. CS-953 TaxID=1671698 RepID=UPI000B9BC8A0|nr:hypothetical protein [Hydrocoleum sp. CS-953]OZH53117.1 hypothetical protein AFK68_19835 [Hydrocoleum sp. CS-953]